MTNQDFSLPQGTHTVVLGVGDLNGIMRGKRIPASHWPHICEAGNAISISIFAIDAACDVWDTPYVNFDTGYPDMHIFPATKPVPIPWEPGVAICFGRSETTDHQPVPIDPRVALQRQIKRAQDMGFEVLAGPELEFFLLDPETNLPRDKGIGVYGLDRAAELEDVLGPIRTQINEILPIEQSNPEYAPGQVEVNLRYCEALLAADRIVLFRTLVKQLAMRHGYKATFMAKPFIEHGGNGFHCHYSLWKDGQNVFATDGKFNETGRAFLGGMQKRMAEASICGAATVNAYRRREPYTFCPVNTAWGIDNRTAGLRVIEGSNSATRIEKRDAGADCNPYLLLAADIAAGLDGIEQGLEPGPICTGNAYEDETASPLPLNLASAIDLARNSPWLKEVLGDVMWEIYAQLCERELAVYEKYMATRVTQLERDRYLDAF